MSARGATNTAVKLLSSIVVCFDSAPLLKAVDAKRRQNQHVGIGYASLGPLRFSAPVRRLARNGEGRENCLNAM